MSQKRTPLTAGMHLVRLKNARYCLSCSPHECNSANANRFRDAHEVSDMTVFERFNKFLSNVALTTDQKLDGIVKHTGVRKCLNQHYYGISSEYANSMLVGSWGKDTQVRPPRDIDVLFVLPYSVYQRYEGKIGNKQSQLLQEVKSVLSKTYSTTKMRADGQVVVVPFMSYAVEVVPAFGLTNGQYWICDTNNGGSYKKTDPAAQTKSVSDSDTQSNGNTRDLVKMMKKWQEYCSVPLKSFCIELVAVEFIATWEYRGKSSVYYDWMVRDFLKHLIAKANGYVIVPGTFEIVWLGDDWKSKAESAYNRAVKGCQYEADETNSSKNVDAWWEWHNIFGDDIPLNP